MFNKSWKSKSEDGSLTIFALVTFLTAISLIGIAIDVARTEMERTRMQLAVDNSVLMAASLNQQTDPDTGEPLTPKQIVDRYLAKANLPKDFDYVTDTDAAGTIAEGVAGARVVKVVGDTTLQTLYMDILGIETLDVQVISQALENPDEPVEVSLVLDMSASMNNAKKMDAMIDGAKGFVSTVLDMNDGANPDLVSISLIIYGGYVNAGRDLAAVVQGEYLEPEYMLSEELWAGRDAYGGFPDIYDHNSGIYVPIAGLCGIFDDAAYDQLGVWNPSEFRAALPTNHTTNNTSWENNNSRIAGTNYDLNWPTCPSQVSSEILPFSNDEQALHDRLDTMKLNWGTAIDDGMRWGTALLDPSVNFAIEDLATGDYVNVTNFPDYRKEYITVPILDGDGNAVLDGDGNPITQEVLNVSSTQEINPAFADRPKAYGDSLKVLVMMSDGANYSTRQPRTDKFTTQRGGWNTPAGFTPEDANPTGNSDDYYWYNPATRQLLRSTATDPRFLAMKDGVDGLIEAIEDDEEEFEDYITEATGEVPGNGNAYGLADEDDIFDISAKSGNVGSGETSDIDLSEGFFFQPTWDDLFAVKHGKELDNEMGYDKVGNIYNAPQSQSAKNARLLGLCEDAVNAGIVVFTVAYEAKEQHAEVLADCADPVNGLLNSFTADTSSIASVFAGISNSLRKLQLVQ